MTFLIFIIHVPGHKAKGWLSGSLCPEGAKNNFARRALQKSSEAV
jgi:hypothetical protein